MLRGRRGRCCAAAVGCAPCHLISRLVSTPSDDPTGQVAVPGRAPRPRRGTLASLPVLGGRLSPRPGGPDAAGSITPELPDGAAAVLDALRSASLVVDPTDRVLRSSPLVTAMRVVRGERIVNRRVAAMVERVRLQRRPLQAELELSRGRLAGEKVMVAVRVCRLGSAGLVLVLLDDQTESVRVDAMRRDFVANVSHELKTPIGALSLLSEATLDAADVPAAVRRFALQMQGEVGRLASMVNELIDLSRLQDNDPLSDPEVVYLDRVVDESVDHTRIAAQAKRITLVVSERNGLTVLGDHAQLVTALRNLLTNAVNYSPDQTRVGIAVRVAGLDPEAIELSVTDQGIGIPEPEQGRIFERFYRVDPARSRATGGTGLGLAIVKHVAANHGGEVTVWSVPGSGSTFTLRLPLHGIVNIAGNGSVRHVAP